MRKQLNFVNELFSVINMKVCTAVYTLALVVMVAFAASGKTYNDESLKLTYEENHRENGTNALHPSKWGSVCKYGICVEDDDYPKEAIEALLQQKPKMKELLYEIKIPRNTDSRILSDGTRTACPSVSARIYPKSMRNTRNEKRYIVNHDKAFQIVDLTICNPPSGSCILKDEIIGYKVECQQTHAVHRFMTMDSQGLFLDDFNVPCGCVCVLKT